MPANPTADRARALVGRRVTVTTDLESEPHPITGRLGHVHEDVYLDLLGVPDRDRSTVRLMIANVATITPAEETT